MTSLFEELKRRNVIRVGAAYVVASWVLLQIADVLIGMLEIPAWIGKLLVVLLILGFPLALIVAWAFEMTPEGLKSEADLDPNRASTSVTARKLDIITIVMVLAALVVFAADRWQMSGREVSLTEPSRGVAVPLDSSVAVLPFDNISRDAENDPFTLGIHQDLLTQISKIGSIKTISRASVMRYQNSEIPIPQIAAQLGVSTVLEGGVQRSGDRVRVNVALIDARSSGRLWSEQYDRQLTAANVFVIQSDIVKAIAEALQATLSSAEEDSIEKIPTENLEALEFYFLGRERIESRNTAAFLEATEYFKKAIELDPEFALAYVGLADSYQFQMDAGSLTRDEMFAKSGKALGKALVLDRESGAAFNSLGGLKWTAGDYPAAEQLFRKAIALSPNYSTAYLWYGLLLVDWGRVPEAISVFQDGIERDPLSPQLAESLGYALELEGRFDESLAKYRQSMKINTTFSSSSYMSIGNVYWMAMGRMGEAVACHKKSIDLDPGYRLSRVYLGLLLMDLGDVSPAEEWISSAQKIAPDSLEPRSARALLDWRRGRIPAALENAAATQDVNPYFQEARMLQTMNLAILRNQELRDGDIADALALYEKAYPSLVQEVQPRIDSRNFRAAIDLAQVLRRAGNDKRADYLLDQSLAFITAGSLTRLGLGGYGIADVHIHALRGDDRRALDALRQAIDTKWRGFWWFYLKDNPNLESLRDNSGFRSMVSELESLVAAEQKKAEHAESC